MPSEISLPEQTKGFFGKLFKKNPAGSEQQSKTTSDGKVEELERSLTKDDPLIESNTFNGDEDDERKNSKNKRRAEETAGTAMNDEENKENIRSLSGRKVPPSRDSRENHQAIKFPAKDPNEWREPACSRTSLPETQHELSSNESDHEQNPVMLMKAPPLTEDDYQMLWKASSQTMRKFIQDASEDVEEDGERRSERLTDRRSTAISKKSEIEETPGESEEKNEKPPLVVVGAESRKKSLSSSKLPRFLRGVFGAKTEGSLAPQRAPDEPAKKSVVFHEEQSDPAPEKKWWGGFKLPGFGRKPKQAPPVAPPQTEVESEKNISDEKQMEVTAEEAERHERVSEDRKEEEEPTTSAVEETPPEDQAKASSSAVSPQADEEPPKPLPRKRTLPTLDITPSEEEARRSEARKPIRRRPRKTKSVRIKESDTDVAEQAPDTTLEVEEPREASETLMDDEDVLAVIVHQTDHLRADLIHMSHPVVRVSVVDGATGNLLRKSSAARRVTSYYEHDNVTSILPVMTQPYDFRKNKSVLPRWDETIIFNESFESMIAQKNVTIQPPSRLQDEEEEPAPIDTGVLAPSPILFFVVRDFVSMTKTNNQRKGAQDVTERGWHTVAWAFLKLVGSNGQPNTDKKLRLQLFQPVRSSVSAASHHTEHSEPAFFWWRDHPRHKYPSTLYVSVKPVKKPTAAETSIRSMFALQPEGGLQAYNEMHKALAFADKSKLLNSDMQQPKWTRLPGQTCKVPNSVSLRLWAASDGAFSVRFSNKGLLLAVACKHNNAYPILFYGIPNGDQMGFLIGHQQLVYDINWSKDDRKIVTSSGDGTAQVWDLTDKTRPTHTLPHPAYVYTGAFHPSAQHIVATGGYDSVIRVWNIAPETAQIIQELEGHKSFINSLAFDHSHLTLYSVDSAGVIIGWNCHTHEQPKKTYKTSWSLKTKFIDKELADVCINSVHVHKGNKKLLIHCRDSIVRMFDVRINTSLNFTGAVNRRQFLRSALTPCGTFVISGSEDGCAYVWNAESGDQVAIYNEMGYPRAVRDVTYHPHEHMVAFCCFAPNMPVLVHKYDRDATMYGGEYLNVVGSTSGTNIDEDGFPARLTKLDRITRQLEAVGPEAESESQGPWLAAKKMVPVAMAVNAFSQKRTRNAPSPIVSPRESSPLRAEQLFTPKAPGGRGPHPSQSYSSMWGSNLGSSATLQPSFLSPHASPDAKLMARQYQATQRQAEEVAGVGWRPTFAAVGGSPYRSESTSAPDVSFSVDEDGNKTLRITATPDQKKLQFVVALYDYQANRSDELTMARGDIIKVLYKDGPSWWFGEKRSDGKQGYFPTNYVVAQEEETIPDESPEVLFGVPAVRPESAESEPGKKIHALKMDGGKVRFYSQSESEGEDESKKAALSLSSRQRRREQRMKTAPVRPPRPKEVLTRETQTFDRQLPTLPTEVKEEPVSASLSATSLEQSGRKSRKRAKKTASGTSIKSPPLVEKKPEKKSVPETFLPETGNRDSSSFSEDRPHFGVLKAVQARMAEQQTSLLSETVVDGAGYPVTRPSRLSALDPVLTSTVERDRKPKKSRLKHRSSRRQTGMLDTDEPFVDENVTDDAIPMVSLKSSRKRDGTPNPAYDDDDVSEV